MKYIVIGGVPFTGYTGTISFTRLVVIYAGDNKKKARAAIKGGYDKHGALLMIIDGITGKEVVV